MPPSWRTLYELSRQEPKALEQAIASGRVHPGLERKDVDTLFQSDAPAEGTWDIDVGVQERPVERIKAQIVTKEQPTETIKPTKARIVKEPRRARVALGTRQKPKPLAWLLVFLAELEPATIDEFIELVPADSLGDRAPWIERLENARDQIEKALGQLRGEN